MTRQMADFLQPLGQPSARGSAPLGTSALMSQMVMMMTTQRKLLMTRQLLVQTAFGVGSCTLRTS